MVLKYLENDQLWWNTPWKARPWPDSGSCDGPGFTDRHDHVLDSIPKSPGHGEYSPLWHVFVVSPACNRGPAHDAAVTAACASHPPTTSEEAVEELLDARLPNGAPVAAAVSFDDPPAIH